MKLLNQDIRKGKEDHSGAKLFAKVIPLLGLLPACMSEQTPQPYLTATQIGSDYDSGNLDGQDRRRLPEDAVRRRSEEDAISMPEDATAQKDESDNDEQDVTTLEETVQNELDTQVTTDGEQDITEPLNEVLTELDIQEVADPKDSESQEISLQDAETEQALDIAEQDVQKLPDIQIVVDSEETTQVEVVQDVLQEVAQDASQDDMQDEPVCNPLFVKNKTNMLMRLHDILIFGTENCVDTQLLYKSYADGIASFYIWDASVAATYTHACTNWSVSFAKGNPPKTAGVAYFYCNKNDPASFDANGVPIFMAIVK